MTDHSAGKARTHRLAALLAIAGAVVLSALVSCCRRDGRVGTYRPLTVDGVPIVRVRLTARPVDSLDISTTERCRIVSDGGTSFRSKGPLSGMPVRLSAGSWSFANRQTGGEYLEIRPDSNGLIRAGEDQFRGTLRLIASSDGGFILVNYIDLESYLAGVLSKELYSYWSAETFRALAVAARTFTLYQMRHFGRSRQYDLTNTQSSQVYGGFSAEIDQSWDAVRGTHGQALAYGPPGREKVFLAQYSACCGGRVNGANVLRNAPDIPPLQGGQPCDDCRLCPRYRWPPVTITTDELYRCSAAAYDSVRQLGGLAAVRVRPILKRLVDEGLAVTEGRARGMKYRCATSAKGD